MKLCRFELKSSPGAVRSGMVYSGKIYETDGSQAVAVHEAQDVRPLSPIPHAPSLRIFRTDLQAADESEPRFFYGNPGMLVGASQLITVPEFLGELTVLPMVAAVIVADAYQVDLQDADDLILGFTLVNLLVGRSEERADRLLGAIGRSHDLGGAIGPVITTPEELEDEVQTAEFGRRHALEAVLRVNGVDRARGSTAELPFTFAQAISYASQTCTLHTGDIISLGPVVNISDSQLSLDPGDEVQLAVSNLGVLSLKLSNAS